MIYSRTSLIWHSISRRLNSSGTLRFFISLCHCSLDGTVMVLLLLQCQWEPFQIQMEFSFHAACEILFKFDFWNLVWFQKMTIVSRISIVQYLFWTYSLLIRLIAWSVPALINKVPLYSSLCETVQTNRINRVYWEIWIAIKGSTKRAKSLLKTKNH